MTIYKFKSKVTGDLIMLAPHGNQVMTILGREPAAQGIIEADAMPAALPRCRPPSMPKLPLPPKPASPARRKKTAAVHAPWPCASAYGR